MMKKHMLRAVVLTATASLALSACGGGDDSGTPAGEGGNSGAVTGKIGVILPDTESSARWENADRPFFQKAFQDAGVESDIQNAQNDATRFQTIADGMISAGVKALIITSLDPDSGGAVIKKATDAGIPVDRKSTRLNSSHANISYAVFCLKKKKKKTIKGEC